jgi:hypothetical protein
MCLNVTKQAKDSEFEARGLVSLFIYASHQRDWINRRSQIAEWPVTVTYIWLKIGRCRPSEAPVRCSGGPSFAGSVQSDFDAI